MVHPSVAGVAGSILGSGRMPRLRFDPRSPEWRRQRIDVSLSSSPPPSLLLSPFLSLSISSGEDEKKKRDMGPGGSHWSPPLSSKVTPLNLKWGVTVTNHPLILGCFGDSRSQPGFGKPWDAWHLTNVQTALVVERILRLWSSQCSSLGGPGTQTLLANTSVEPRRCEG